MRGSIAVLLVSALSAACANEYHPDYHPQSEYTYSQNISYPTTVFQSGSGAPVVSDAPATAAGARGDAAKVLVLQTTHLDRPSEVVGVVDAHEEMGHHEAALTTLRKRAAALGADAVVGVEFHHGEGEGEPTHLSGLAVRFLQSVPYPVER